MSDSITAVTPLPPEALRFESMSFSEGLSQLGEMQLRLTSPQSDIDADALLGKPVSVRAVQRDGSLRYFNGYVTRFALGAPVGRRFGYEATVRPWLWFLTRTADCRIFQAMTVPEIVKKVFADHDIANYEFTLFRSYRPWVYCVQYRESDYNFIARLLEHEGIYFFVEHDASGHRLKLVDSQSVHDAAPGCAALPFIAHDAAEPPDLDHVWQWQSARAVQPGRMALTSYDFERPRTSLRVDAGKVRGHELADAEVFDYQGDYVQSGDGAQLADDRIDEAQVAYEQAGGQTNAQGLATGRLVTLERHPSAGQNLRYLVTSTRVTARADGSDFGHGASEGRYHCGFTAMPATQQYRPPRVTPKPFVQGPQTAVVVGPAGEEIHTDVHGRVKVQFHWDRRGQKNEKSSCWVRVSHPWAGKSFGGIHIPRIGQEVVVDFLEGDPDQPLITGRVYNADQMPPWELPANATQSGFLTRSTKGGHYGTANALRFEDKKGEEQLWLRAEKDQLTEVEHDEDKWVGNDRRKTIDRDETNHIKRDRTETVDRDETITVHNNRTETVDGHEKITVHKTRTEEVDGNETITIHSNRGERVDHNEQISIGDNRTEDVGKSEQISIGQNQSLHVGANRSKSVGSSETVKIGTSWSINVGSFKTETIAMASMQSVGLGRMENVGLGYSLNVGAMMVTVVGQSKTEQIGKTLSITAAEKVEIVCGSSKFVMTPEAIYLDSKAIHLKSGTKIHLDGPDDVLLNTGTAQPAPSGSAGEAK
jgi:type VI secretion system secreted protein VgrG